jgi:hypothetical protein
MARTIVHVDLNISFNVKKHVSVFMYNLKPKHAYMSFIVQSETKISKYQFWWSSTMGAVRRLIWPLSVASLCSDIQPARCSGHSKEGIDSSLRWKLRVPWRLQEQLRLGESKARSIEKDRVYLVAFESNTFGFASMKVSYSASSPVVTSLAVVGVPGSGSMAAGTISCFRQGFLCLFFVDIQSSFPGSSCQKRVLGYAYWRTG